MDKRYISIDPKTLKIVDSFFTRDIDNDRGRSKSLIHMLVDRDINIRNTKIIKVSESEYKINPIVPEEQYNEEYSRQTTLEALKQLRQERNRRLAEVDWVFSTDYHIPSELRKKWTAYRQALRDLPSVTEDPENPVWPEKPTTDPSGGSTVSVDLDHIGNLTSQISLLQNVVFSLTKRIEALEQA